ncbi:UNVERIFIED_CONTAM: AraC family transcriptional regulator [Methylobacteriaceae bacterium AG10]|nr:AraC family transcriptional regulator [Methylobacteriaceae bacterium AG10]
METSAQRRGARDPAFHRISIEKIEDLTEAVRDANLQATQLGTTPLSGSLFFGEQEGVTCSSGLLHGRVGLKGPLSCDMITLGAGLRLHSGCWQWLTEAETGGVGIFRAADVHNSLYAPGSLYAAVTLTSDHLESEAAKLELVLDRKTLGGSGVHARRLPSNVVERLARKFDLIHRGKSLDPSAVLDLLTALIEHLGRPPINICRRPGRNHHAHIVHRARTFIHEHLADAISLDAIAEAAQTSRRTLYRAFAEILNDTPQSYVRRLRLHRVREGLAGEAETACTIAVIANQWGMSELGRMAKLYRELFGEKPSETRARAAIEYPANGARTPNRSNLAKSA